MMNLDEILKGIGGQMAAAASPPWRQPVSPQPAPDPMPPNSMGQFGNYLNAFPTNPDPGPQWGASPSAGPQWGSSPSAGPQWGSAQDPGPNWLQSQALGHIAAATAPAAPTTPAHAGTASANDAETEAYIRQSATARGIDPNVAVKVWSGEGRGSYAGDQGSSFGPYQLHYGNVAGGGNAVSGMGDSFTSKTGLNARDPSTWQAQVDYALDGVAKGGGWTPYHAAAAQGIGPHDGIGTRAAAAAPGAQAAQSIMDKAQPFIGNAYVWGGKTAQSGFDCSGLAGYLTTGQAESTRTLYAKSQAVNATDAHPGDLVFYNMAGSQGPSDEHVATYIGNGQIVQAGGTAHNVNVAQANQFTAPGWQPEYRRLTGA